MKTWKKVVIGLIVLGVIGIVACVVVDLSSSPKSIIPASSVEYQTKEELTDLYLQNTTLLNSVKDSVLSNDGMMRDLNKFNEGDIEIFSTHVQGYFSEEEWRNIVSVFENLHPYMIMMERKGRPLKFYIDFPQHELETGYMYTSLYWFPDVKEIKYHKEVSSADRVEYTHLDGNWYIVEETYER